jgi:bifunctional enzyme CysN/CysC
VWLTGLSGSGKSTIAVELERQLVTLGRYAYRLDGDNLRHGLNSDLDFSEAGRKENIRRVGEVCKLFADACVITIASFISPYGKDRDAVRQLHDGAGLQFNEVFVDTPIEVCEKRDPKGLYKKARAGELKNFTGIDAPYEKPTAPELLLKTGDTDTASCVQHCLTKLRELSIL